MQKVYCFAFPPSNEIPSLSTIGQWNINLDPNRMKLAASSGIGISDFSIVLLSKNHEVFISDCLKSIYRELPEVKVFCVDIGSKDDTFLKGKSISQDLNLNSEHIQFNDTTKTLLVLKKIEKRVNTKFAILISADDAFGIQYRDALLGIFKNENRQVVVNFNSLITDRYLRPLHSRKPLWSVDLEKNKRRLSYSNPGTTPGAVIPWKILTGLASWKEPPDILIEDYWIWWQLIDLVPFINSSESYVLYRQHANNVSKSTKNKSYAASLGYVTALPNVNAQNFLNRFFSFLLVVRWIRHLNVIVWKDFFAGYLSGIRSKIL
jgi:hypothetical protein